jgi:DNA-binding NtrC family response regulator
MTAEVKAGRPQGRVPTQTDTKDSDADRSAVSTWTHLYLIIESDHPLDGGARYSLRDVDEVSLGRGDERVAIREQRNGKRHLRITVQNKRTSESHARLTRSPAGWLLEDLGSKNGTFLNGNQVVGRTAVRSGDVIRTGRAFYTVGDATAAADADLARDVETGKVDAFPVPGFPTLVPVLSEQLRKLRPAMESDDPITIVGRTGTGKEVLAHAIHDVSRRRGPFVPLDCSRLSANLIEGELFGYTKGAYTGAERSELGHIRLANKGTAFIDEILELPIAQQAKLLRVIQEREVVPLGTAQGVKVDVRFIAASQHRFADVVASGKFRPDLQGRLEWHVIELPTLRERLVDVGLLTAAILRKHGAKDGDQIPSRAIENILGYSWPNNIRELEGRLVSALRAARDRILDAEAFPPPDVGVGATEAGAPLSPEEQHRRNALVAALTKHRGKIVDVANEIGTNRQQVYRLLERFGLEADAFRAAAGLADED